MTTSAKNMMISPAVSDLGLGDQLVQSLQDEDEERKKKLLQQANQMSNMGAPALVGMSPGVAAMMNGRISGL